MPGPPNIVGQSFTGDVGSNIVHRKILEPDGVGFDRPPGRRRQGVRRLDRQLVSPGPVRQRARRHAVHHRRLPRSDRTSAQPAAGDQEVSRPDQRARSRTDLSRRARRISSQRPLPAIERHARPRELVAATGKHRTAGHRDTAARLLYRAARSRGDRTRLEKLAAESKLPQARMHALYALAGLHALTPAVVIARLADEHPRVREHAVRLSEPLAGESSPSCARSCIALADDPDMRVRYQLAFTLGEVQRPGAPRGAGRDRAARCGRPLDPPGRVQFARERGAAKCLRFWPPTAIGARATTAAAGWPNWLA